MNDMRDIEMTDAELDHLLAQASVVDLPAGAQDRLLRQLGPVPAVYNADRRWAMKAALPLAASLLLGIYLGAGGYGDRFFPSTASTVQDDGELYTTGFEEVVSAAEEDMT